MKISKRERFLDIVFFIGGSFFSIIALAGIFYTYEIRQFLFLNFVYPQNIIGWSFIILAISISLIIYGFLRRNWKKQKIDDKT